jgi:sec-independent protein translocase protein TatA
MHASRKKECNCVGEFAKTVKCIFLIDFLFYLYVLKKIIMGDLFSGPHILLIALVVLLLFGGKKIPELMRGLGRGIREFKDAKDNVRREIEDHMDDNHPSSNANSSSNKQVSSGSSVNN